MVLSLLVGENCSVVVVVGFVFVGWDVAERPVQSRGVEPCDVLDDRKLELAAGLPDAVADQFGLERVDEALREGVDVRVADRSDRRQEVVVVTTPPTVTHMSGEANTFTSACQARQVNHSAAFTSCRIHLRHPNRAGHRRVNAGWPPGVRETDREELADGLQRRRDLYDSGAVPFVDCALEFTGVEDDLDFDDAPRGIHPPGEHPGGRERFAPRVA